MINFTKMHALGNDFVVLDGVRQKIKITKKLIQYLADRHRGVGCDQVLLIEPSNHQKADFNYRIFNADGTEVFQCGNGARCVGLFINQEKLRVYLSEKLPEYMIPAAFIRLDNLPLNLSGKIDRKALQAKDFRLVNPIHAFAEPTNDIEKNLWQIWHEILKTDQFGIDNSFFELGGHSL